MPLLPESLKLTGLDAQMYTKNNYLKRTNKAAAPSDKNRGDKNLVILDNVLTPTKQGRKN